MVVISRGVLSSGRLPEGLYEFCVEVTDVLSGELLSQSAWLQFNVAPILNYPSNGDLINDELETVFNF